MRHRSVEPTIEQLDEFIGANVAWDPARDRAEAQRLDERKRAYAHQLIAEILADQSLSEALSVPPKMPEAQRLLGQLIDYYKWISHQVAIGDQREKAFRRLVQEACYARWLASSTASADMPICENSVGST